MFVQKEDGHEAVAKENKLKMLSCVEMLKNCHVDNTTTTFLTSDILNQFPKLRFLQIHGEKINSPNDNDINTSIQISFQVSSVSIGVFGITQCVLLSHTQLRIPCFLATLSIFGESETGNLSWDMFTTYALFNCVAKHLMELDYQAFVGTIIEKELIINDSVPAKTEQSNHQENTLV